MNKRMYFNQKGAIPVLMIVAAIGLIIFLVLANIFDFRNTIFNALFPKPLSNAASCNQAPNNPSFAQINVKVPSTGEYVIWSRIMSQGDTSNSFYLQVDNNSCILIIGDSNTIPTGVWTWVDFSDGNPATKTSVNLTAGDHTIKIMGRESQVKVDEIMLTNDPTCTSVDSVGQCVAASNSLLLLGSNLGVWGMNGDGSVNENFVNQYANGDDGGQAELARGVLGSLRFSVREQGKLTDAGIKQVQDKITSVGVEPLVVLPADDTEVTRVVNIAKNVLTNTKYFEYGNEDNYFSHPQDSATKTGWNGTTYGARWKVAVPQLRAARPDAKIGGPVVSHLNPGGSTTASDNKYVIDFLNSIKGQPAMYPDFISFHLYNEHGESTDMTTNQILADVQDWGTRIDWLRNTVKTTLCTDSATNATALCQQNIPLALTEWNWDARPEDNGGGRVDNRDKDETFMRAYTNAVLDMLRSKNVFMANQYGYGSDMGGNHLTMLSPWADPKIKPQYYAFKDYAALLKSSPTAAPTSAPTAAPTASPTAPASYDKSVSDYGAKGDGSTNDTTAFTNAIAATPTGGTLFVPKPASSYRISGTININKAIKIVGDASTLQKTTTGVMFNLFANNITIDNLRMIGPGNSGVAVYTDTANLTGIVIQNNYIQGWVDGIALTRSAGLKILNNNIRNNQYAGIALTSSVGTYLGAGKPTVAELRSGADLSSRFSIVIDGNTIYDVKGNGDASRNAYGITISDDGTLQPARALVVRNRVEYVSTWECYDTHAGKELYFLDNYCYMSIRAFNLSSDSRYTNKMTDVYAVRNTVVKGPQGAVPTGIGMTGDIFSSTGGGTYASLESIVLVDSSSFGPAAGGVYDNKLFGYGFTGWSGIDVRNTTLAPVAGNVCYQSVTGDVNSTQKACP